MPSSTPSDTSRRRHRHRDADGRNRERAGWHRDRAALQQRRARARDPGGGRTRGDRAWHMQLWDEYQDALKSNFADFPNAGSDCAVTAAYFLARFTKRYPWAHLDIAGTASVEVRTRARRAGRWRSCRTSSSGGRKASACSEDRRLRSVHLALSSRRIGQLKPPGSGLRWRAPCPRASRSPINVAFTAGLGCASGPCLQRAARWRPLALSASEVGAADGEDGRHLGPFARNVRSRGQLRSWQTPWPLRESQTRMAQDVTTERSNAWRETLSFCCRGEAISLNEASLELLSGASGRRLVCGNVERGN